MQTNAPVSGELVLLGGGHAQVAVLKSFAMRPLPGLRLTIVSRDINTPYSGMLPAFVEGVWTEKDIHIDLVTLAAMANARFIHAEATGIDTDDKRILFADRPPVKFDMLSINIGGRPNLAAIDGAAQHAVPVKPISRFRHRLDDLVSEGYPRRIAIIGGGAAGCELALAFARRWHRDAGTRPDISIFGRSARLVPEMPPRAARLLHDALRNVGCTIRCGAEVTRIEDGALTLADGKRSEFDAVFLVSAVTPPAWLAHSGLTLDEAGFIAVGPHLQSLSHDFVFAAGDIAALNNNPRPKSGVYAVRAGPVLAENLRRFAMGRTLRRWRPQKTALALVGTADGKALAVRGKHISHSRSAWWLKKWIDRRWMAKYTNLSMPPPPAPRPLAGLQPDRVGDEAIDPAFEAMRCLGCGAKTSHKTLEAALQDAIVIARDLGANPDLLPVACLGEDSAILPAQDGGNLVQSVDVISEITTDPFQLGRIAAVHALSDIYAANATPQHALAIINMAPARSDLQREHLTQIMAGSLMALAESGTLLVGGHTSETDATTVGFAVTGTRLHAPTPPRLEEDPVLVITKPVGTGVLMAGAMQLVADGDWVKSALASMAVSNGIAADLLAADCPVMTDVTGFGLARHALNLAERCRYTGVEITLSAVPLLDGADILLDKGVRSSLHDQNAASVRLAESVAESAQQAALFDPQTSGGLLAALPRVRAEAAIDRLRAAGQTGVIIGRLTNAWTGLYSARKG